MTRLYLIVEGQTEEGLVKQVLTPHLRGFGLECTPIIVTTRRDPRTGAKLGRGGGFTFGKWKNDILAVMKQQAASQAWVSTLFDLYGLPEDFPGFEVAQRQPHRGRRAEVMEAALGEVIAQELPLHGWRFIPYVQLHEMEALVLACLDALAETLDGPDQLAGLRTLKAELAGLAPEDVNDGKETAPSKRLERHIRGYQKTVHGILALEDTPLAVFRGACPRFDAWLKRLEGLGAVATP